MLSRTTNLTIKSSTSPILYENSALTHNRSINSAMYGRFTSNNKVMSVAILLQAHGLSLHPMFQALGSKIYKR
jgi:hypothetical protein